MPEAAAERVVGTTMGETLLTYSEAGKRICGISAYAVAALVRKKVLAARVLVVRGANRRPRKGILASEVERYLKSLPEPDANGKAPAAKRQRRGIDAALRKELDECVRYV